jgi:hypothetical protein
MHAAAIPANEIRLTIIRSVDDDPLRNGETAGYG